MVTDGGVAVGGRHQFQRFFGKLSANYRNLCPKRILHLPMHSVLRLHLKPCLKVAYDSIVTIILGAIANSARLAYLDYAQLSTGRCLRFKYASLAN